MFIININPSLRRHPSSKGRIDVKVNVLAFAPKGKNVDIHLDLKLILHIKNYVNISQHYLWYMSLCYINNIRAHRSVSITMLVSVCYLYPVSTHENVTYINEYLNRYSWYLSSTWCKSECFDKNMNIHLDLKLILHIKNYVNKSQHCLWYVSLHYSNNIHVHRSVSITMLEPYIIVLILMIYQKYIINIII